MRGYAALDAMGLATLVNEAFEEDAVLRLEERCTPLNRATETIESHEGYMRNSDRAAAASLAERALDMRRDKLWIKYATERHRAAWEEVKEWAADSEKLARERNEAFVRAELERFAELFDTVESMPLTPAQRLACVRDEDNNLVLAGAGTGKTSTMIGRAAYLVKSGRAEPKDILMIAYGNKAAAEMRERYDRKLKPLLGGDPPTISTFHKLGLEIVGQVEGRRPDISVLATDEYRRASFISNTIEVNCDDEAYRAKLVRYLGTDRFVYKSPFDFASIEEYNEYVREEELRTLNGEAVKSFEELEIANLLNANSIPYVYEQKYEHNLADAQHRQYKPDFYLPEHGIYIEHFALDRNGQPPAHFHGYVEGVEWKRAVHAEHGTRLIETASYQKREGTLERDLLGALRDAGVEPRKRDDNEMLTEMREQSMMLDFASFVASFVALARESGVTLDQLREVASRARDRRRFELILDITAPVLHAYIEELRTQREVDFADMIHAAADYVENGDYVPHYTHIMIDEFQDISGPRARLAKALQHQAGRCSLFAVGDDWQAIYRFAGSDIRFTTEFEQRFGPTASTALDKTFRFNDKLGAVAAKFVLRNENQIRKEMRSHFRVTEPAVSLVASKESAAGLLGALSAIDARRVAAETEQVSVLVIARFGFVLDEVRTALSARLGREYPALSVEFATAHASKGREADYVVVLGMSKGRYGFPSTKRTDEVLNALLPPVEKHPHAEERRLFYVALTRARQRTYLVFDPDKRSPFVAELMDKRRGYEVIIDEVKTVSGPIPDPVACPECKSGLLVMKSGSRGSFFACDNYPYCEYTEPGCPDCGSYMISRGKARVCSNTACDRLVPVCPDCGGHMVLRPSRWGNFWGCSNYRGEDQHSCSGKAKVKAFPARGVEWNA